MIKGIGIDIVELDDIRKQLSNIKFITRILTEKERAVYNGLSERRQLEFLAGRFSAKEALAKAAGMGIGSLSFQDIEVLPNENGQPIVSCPRIEERMHVSISHSKEYVVSQVILEEK